VCKQSLLIKMTTDFIELQCKHFVMIKLKYKVSKSTINSEK
jgi:hypothetical protein